MQIFAYFIHSKKHNAHFSGWCSGLGQVKNTNLPILWRKLQKTLIQIFRHFSSCRNFKTFHIFRRLEKLSTSIDWRLMAEIVQDFFGP